MSANAALPDITRTFRCFGVIPVIMMEDASASAGLARALAGLAYVSALAVIHLLVPRMTPAKFDDLSRL